MILEFIKGNSYIKIFHGFIRHIKENTPNSKLNRLEISDAPNKSSYSLLPCGVLKSFTKLLTKQEPRKKLQYSFELEFIIVLIPSTTKLK